MLGASLMLVKQTRTAGLAHRVSRGEWSWKYWPGGASMSLYKNVIFPILKHTDPESAHQRAMLWLRVAQELAPGRAILRGIGGETPRRPVTVAGLRFPNVLGVAAGFDKDVEVAWGLGMLGFGHVEVGTLTPHPQEGNPKPRVFRLPGDRAIINRMGFPNAGVRAVLPRLRRLWRLGDRPVIGVSLGKQKETALENAAADYQVVMREVFKYSDYLAVNISSPNTPGLRGLQSGDFIESLCRTLVGERDALGQRHGGPRRPLFVKIAPDLSRAELDTILDAATAAGIDGLIATNTTVKRPGIRDPKRKEAGGLSGVPVRERSTRIIRYIHGATEGKLPIIGVGGVFTAEDAREKLDAGASLIQLYTGLVYEGPGIAGRILRER